MAKTTSDKLLTEKKYRELEKELALKNHELEIEAALERVRSSSLTMHKSEDIRNVVAVVSKELANLNINGDAVNIALFKPDSKDHNIYTATADINYARIISIPYIDIAFFNKM